MGIGFLGIGFQPKWRREDVPMMPKVYLSLSLSLYIYIYIYICLARFTRIIIWCQGRYKIIENYMPKVGSLGLDMMLRTCTVQVNLDLRPLNEVNESTFSKSD